jgi:small subunit ribosomal protein S1
MIQEVLGQNMTEEQETVENPVGQPQDSTGTAVADEGFTMEDVMAMEDMDAFYESSMSNFKEGEVVKGTIISITDDNVLVDIGYKSEGIVSLDEFYNGEELKPGDECDIFIEEPEDDDGMPVLSKIKADKIKNWANIQEVYEEDGIIEGRIVRRVKGGLKVDIGIDAFMPASQLTWRPTSDLERFIGQRMDVKIIKLTKRRRNVVVSRRKLLEEQRAGEKSKLLATIQVGQVLTGEVKNITDFGAFVDVGGIDGLLHVTDMSWGRVKHPSQVVSVGDKIDVMVLSFDPQTERISLGLKQKTDNPWTTAEARYPIGNVVRGRVVSMTDYGAFVQLEDGIEGMVHVSEMSWTRRVRHPNEVVGIEDETDVMVLSVDPQAEKIALGFKQTQPNPWRLLETKYPVGTAITAAVRNLADYGAFVEIEEGIDALLHVSDISWTKKVTHPSEILQKGQEVQVKVLSIDPESEKIAVGLKQMEEDPWERVIESHSIGTHIEVEIAKLVSFGAFAQLEDGVEGLIHVSELSDERVQKPEEVLSVGDKVMAKVISIDPNERKIGLSLREYQHDQDRQATDQYGASGGSGPVNVGEAVGDAVPQSMLTAGQTLAEAANEMMAEMQKKDAPAKAAPAVEAPATEAPAADAPSEGEAPVEEAAPASAAESSGDPVAAEASPADSSPVEAEEAPSAEAAADTEEKAD